MYKRQDGKYKENISDLSGISKKHPLIAISLLIILFSLAGVPPLGGFFAKFYVFVSVLEKDMYALAIIGLLTTVMSAFYYLRIIKTIYFDPSKEKYDSNHSLGLRISLIVSTIFLVFYFTYPNSLLGIISKINII